MTQEQRELQRLDVGAIHVGVRQDDDLVVTQAVEHRSRRVRLVRIDAQRHRDVMHLVVGENFRRVDLESVQHFAAQRQHRLELAVARLLGAAAGRIALDQEDFVLLRRGAGGVGELARQQRDAGAGALLDHLAGARTGLRALDCQAADALRLGRVVVEPAVQRVLDALVDQLHRFAVVQLVLGLALEARLQHLGAEHIARVLRHVLRLQRELGRHQAVVGGVILDRFEQRLPHARLVHAAARRRNQVHEGFAHRPAFRKGDRPLGALALVIAGDRGACAAEQRHRQIAQLFAQVVAQAVGVLPLLHRPALFVFEADAHAGQHGAAGAQQVFDVGLAHAVAGEILRIRPRAHTGTGVRLRTAADLGQPLRNAVVEGDRMFAATALHGRFQPGGQRVGNGDADAVQTAGDLVGLALELAARVRDGEDDFDRRHLLGRMDIDRNAATVVLDRHRAVAVHHHPDAVGEAALGLVAGVVDHFLDDVVRTVGPGVHVRPLLYGRNALEHLDF